MWHRAIDIATRGLHSDARQKGIRNLSAYEEILCNRIAGDVLVPEEHLIRILGNSLAQIDYIHLALRSASHEFRVSLECLLIRINRAILDDQLSYPENLCVLIITNSDRKGGESRSRRDLRIRETIMPRRLLGVRIKALFPGLAVRNLGQEVVSTLEAAMAPESGKNPSTVNLSLSLATPDGSSVTTKISGWIIP